MGGTGSTKESISILRERWLPLALTLLIILAILLIADRRDPALSHTLAEMFSVVVACSVFMLTWNAREFIDNHYFIFLGIACLFVGVIDCLHAILFGGGFNPETYNPSLELWFSARFLQSAALMFAPIFVSRRLRPLLVFLGFAAPPSCLSRSHGSGAFPVLYIPGKGVTPAEGLCDDIIVGIQILSVVALWRVRKHFDGKVFQLLAVSIFFSIAAELLDDLRPDTYIYGSLLGHYLNVVSFYLVYKAIIATASSVPMICCSGISKGAKRRSALPGMSWRPA